nr:hypothetical protein [Rhodococcus sp. DK17]
MARPGLTVAESYGHCATARCGTGDCICRPIYSLTRVLPVVLRDAVPNVLRNPAAVWHVAHLARTANLAHELAALAARRLPVFVVWSTRDTVIPESTSLSMRAALGDPRTIVVPGGHAWLIDDPHAFGELITNVMLDAGLETIIHGSPGSFPGPGPATDGAAA